ncbi:MAG: hypothetical protein E7563_03455 [Ruminococcaceae bacterium]|nr:hypothetical protein [Oscillospiraceae bacterium]
MKKSINFAKLSMIMFILAGAFVVAGVLLLVINGGNTFAPFTFANLSFSLVVKALVAAVLTFALVLVYLLIRFKKQGVKMALISTLGASINALVAFALCILGRANLCNMALAVVLFAVALSYVTFIIFSYNFNKKTSRKKNAESQEDAFSVATDKAWQVMKVVLILTTGVILAGFVAAIIYSAGVLALYGIPAILTAVFSVLFTLSYTCKLFADKV